MARATDSGRIHREAERRAKAWDGVHARAISAEYRSSDRRIHVELSNGLVFGFPVDHVQGLAEASEDALSDMRITPSGHALHWESLDVDHLLAPLMSGVFGTRAWMQRIGRKGGSVTSKRKAAAARINGRKGGRPRKR